MTSFLDEDFFILFTIVFWKDYNYLYLVSFNFGKNLKMILG